ncbi:hypothetical protein HAX54_047050, partial [Datura stramonium]|nr:hypothetical protein [Datura stramonium]
VVIDTPFMLGPSSFHDLHQSLIFELLFLLVKCELLLRKSKRISRSSSASAYGFDDGQLMKGTNPSLWSSARDQIGMSGGKSMYSCKAYYHCTGWSECSSTAAGMQQCDRRSTIRDQ